MKTPFDPHRTAWLQFRTDCLSSKLKGTHTEKELLVRLIELSAAKNPHAQSAIKAAKMAYAPDSRMCNSIWEIGAIFAMGDAASPEQTGPAGTDNFGLWREKPRSA
jgi:hypothetical protein